MTLEQETSLIKAAVARAEKKFLSRGEIRMVIKEIIRNEEAREAAERAV